MKSTTPTRDCCKGVIAFLPTVFDRKGNIDVGANRENVRKLIEAGCPSIQSTGGAGEFYALDLKQHTRMVEVIAEEAVGKVHTMAGCGAHSTQDAIERAMIAEQHGIESAIFVTPYYFATQPVEIYRFFNAIASACPELGLVHFNTPRSKTMLTVEHYEELAKNPNFIGSKQPFIKPAEWYTIQQATPSTVHFTTDELQVPMSFLGCEGVDSLMAAVFPEVALLADRFSAQKLWQQAAEMQKLIWRTLSKTSSLPELEAKYSDAALDKATVHAAGFLWAGDPKPPYLPVSESDMQLLKRNLQTARQETEETLSRLSEQNKAAAALIRETLGH